MLLTTVNLDAVCAHPEEWVDGLNVAINRFDITTVQRAAMFLATCAFESERFVSLEENLNYSADRLLEVFPSRFNPANVKQYAKKASLIANHIYANRGGNGDEASGDGWRYKGRGPIQITFKNNYEKCGTALGLPLLTEPELLAQVIGGSLSAAWFWQNAGCNDVADEGDFAGVSGIINRGDRHKAALNLGGRFQWLVKAQGALSNLTKE